ncbi:MAG: anti-sigma F factor [Turicibacter sp.]|nr:anti-sigma F factor [Turicibacter sp.]MBQ1786551.1 anti-sigma F factor [Turicibacter sp.]MEE1238268.1 anti-sigma F factor [Turicibacter sp.]
MNNEMHLQFPAKSINESFARLVIIGFIAPLDPNSQELNEIKTIVSEGVTNAIIHGYEDNEEGIIDMKASLEGRRLRVTIQDFGRGIDNIELAKQPLYTTKQEQERSGLGFMIMESFSDKFEVISVPGVGTTISFEKEFLPIDSSTK